MAQQNPTYRCILFDHAKHKGDNSINPFEIYESAAADRATLQQEIEEKFPSSYEVTVVHWLG